MLLICFINFCFMCTISFSHAMELTSLGTGLFVCDTWVLHNESVVYAHISLKFLRPLILVDKAYFSGNVTFSYDQEFSEEDILNSNFVGVRKFATNCASLFINAMSTTITVDTTFNLISRKIGRPHKDFFIFVGPKYVLEKVFNSSIQIQEIRYRYALEQTNNANNFDQKSFRLQNFCSKGNNEVDLFSRKCDTHITGRHFRVTASSISPFVHFNTDKSRKTESPAGILYLLFLDTSNRLNFTFDLRSAGFLGSSGFKANSIWYGAVGEVFKREADIAFGVATTVHRFPINDPGVTQVWITRYFYIRAPPFYTSWGSIFWSLTPNMWILIAATIVFLILPVYYFCAKAYLGNLNSPKNIMSQLIEAIYRIMMEQSGAARNWKGTRIRFMIILWAFFCLVIGTGYKTKLINFLTFLGQESIPLTHQELSKSDFQLFFRWMGGVAYKHTASSPDPMHKRIMKRAVMVNTSEEGLFRALFVQNSAWMDYSINADFAIQRYATLNPNMKENPLFVRSKDSDYTCHIVWSFRKGSPWTESFDEILLRILAAGLYNFYEEETAYQTRVRGAEWLRTFNDTRIIPKFEEILESLDERPKPLNKGALLGLLYVWMVGACTGFFIWIIEKGFHHGQKVVVKKMEEFYKVTRTLNLTTLKISLETKTRKTNKSKLKCFRKSKVCNNCQIS